MCEVLPLKVVAGFQTIIVFKNKSYGPPPEATPRLIMIQMSSTSDAILNSSHRELRSLDGLPFHEETTDECKASCSNRTSVGPSDSDIICF